MTAPSSVKDNLIAARALEWRVPTDHPMDLADSAILVADGIGGKYHISGPELIDRKTGAQGYLLWFAADEFVWKAFETIDAAKAHAETDWQACYADRAISSQEQSE